MSQENVEVLRQALEAWQRDDFEAFLLRTHPEIEWQAVLQRLVEGLASAYHGHEGMRRLWDDYRTDFEGFEAEAEKIRDVGDDRVVLLGRIRFRGSASGAETESPFAAVQTIRDGKIFRSVDYLSHAEALKAVGLEE